MKNFCPVCRNNEITCLYKTDVPTLQNRVYTAEAEAANCTTGIINLAHCNVCNFTFNAAFDNNIILYDKNYDNAVPSKIFIEYYQTICKYLYEKYNLAGGTVYDIGCGKGTFLNMLCAQYPDVTGIGIDPSYVGDLNPLDNLSFIQDFFNAGQVTDAPDLVISRHVFEHIEFPKDFLEIIRAPLEKYNDVPVFIEVPDFNWIVENKTFWDLCYEHCNYFSEFSIQSMFDYPWSKLNSITKSFGEQYLWVEGMLNSTGILVRNSESFKIEKSRIIDFIGSITESANNIKHIVHSYRNMDYKIVVWGMATKGVIFTNNIDKEKNLVDYCVDINTEKQNRYSPISAHLIQEPDVLNTITGKLLIIVMNTNYLAEIRQNVQNFEKEAHFIDAHGNDL